MLLAEFLLIILFIFLLSVLNQKNKKNKQMNVHRLKLCLIFINIKPQCKKDLN